MTLVRSLRFHLLTVIHGLQKISILRMKARETFLGFFNMLREKRDREAERSRRSSGYVRRDLVEDLGGKIPLLKDNQSFHLARLTDKFEKEQERKRKSRVRLSSPKKTVRERLGPRTSPEPAQEDILGAHVDINLLGQFLELIQYYSMNILRSFLPAI